MIIINNIFRFAIILILCCLSISYTYSNSFYIKREEIPISDPVNKSKSYTVLADIYQNDIADINAIDVLLVHGMSCRSNFFDRFAQQFLKNSGGNNLKIGRIISLSLTGHSGGDSGESQNPAYDDVPGSMQFGDIGLDVYRDEILDALDYLNNQQGYKIKILLGHSMGGILIQMAQQKLLDNGSSLKQAFDISGIQLVASVLPENIRWAYVTDTANMLKTFVPFTAYSPNLGLYFKARKTEDWLALLFSNTAGKLDIAAPEISTNQTDVLTANQLKNTESYVSVLEMTGLDILTEEKLQRPYIDAGIFANYHLEVLSYDEDIFMTPTEEEHLFEYLSTTYCVEGVCPVYNDLYSQQFSKIEDSSPRDGNGDYTHGSPNSHPESMNEALVRLINAVY